jgi:hypothetical protein
MKITTYLYIIFASTVALKGQLFEFFSNSFGQVNSIHPYGNFTFVNCEQDTILLPSEYKTKLSNMEASMKLGNRVSITLQTEGDVAHSVVMKSIMEKTITKVNGSITTHTIYNVMNPANGGSYMNITSYDMSKALNIFYIYK